MVLKKQTIWLLTMLTLMVALSAYYLLNGEPDEIAITDHNPYTQLNGQNNQDNTSVVDNSIINDMGINMTTTQAMDTENYFSTLRLEREQSRSQKMEKYNQTVQNSKDNNAVAEASAKMEELDLLGENESLVESLIKSQGSYADAVVYTQDNKVNVIVQKNELKKEEVVSIINLVAKNMNVSGTNVFVSSRP